MNGIDYEALARELARFLSPDALLTATDIGSLTGYSTRYVQENLAKSPGFPKCIKLVGANGKLGDPRWLKRHVSDWIEGHLPGEKVGRPRKRLVTG